MMDQPPERYRPVPPEIITKVVDEKFKLEYSAKLGKKVYVLKQWLEKGQFERHKRLFGHTDIGWTVKYPRHLARVLLIEGIWKVDEEW